ncbi:MAG: hypothetical protein SFY66_21735 [Oculatellaceae cyanobacterium bins.114]|nr:hypothetical protein [Oculatellaceae cyanobacterium bins.114]
MIQTAGQKSTNALVFDGFSGVRIELIADPDARLSTKPSGQRESCSSQHMQVQGMVKGDEMGVRGDRWQHLCLSSLMINKAIGKPPEKLP